MKRIRLVMLALLPAAFVLFTTPSFSQGSVAPDGQFGIWASTGGLGIAYAISPSIQIGTGFGFVTGDNPTAISVSPYVKFLFEGDVNPYIIAGLGVASVENSDTQTSLLAGFGLDYYINPSVGFFAHVTVLDVGLAPEGSATNYGLSASGTAGVEWYLN